jgi:hypothetical protein
MTGAEIVIGVIIGVVFELLSDNQRTPSKRGSDSNPGTVQNPFRTIELANATGITR